VLERVVRPRVGEFFASELVRWLLVFNLITIVATVGLIVWQMWGVSYPVILHYNVFFGIDKMGQWQGILNVLAIGAVIFVINTIAALSLYRKKERIAAYMVLFGSLTVQVGIAIFVISVLVVN
jgi:predicted ATPase